MDPSFPEAIAVKSARTGKTTGADWLAGKVLA